MSKRWLVTGGNGQLAQEFSRVLKLHQENVTSLDRSELDLERLSEIELVINKYHPTHIINCAAWTDVEGAESHPNQAQKVNSEAPGRLAQVAKDSGAYLVHFSTDYVFDGTSRVPYLPTDAKNPQSIYGASKSAGEDLVRQILPNDSIVIRTAWLYSAFGNNFVRKIIELEKSRPTLSVVDDQIGQPTWCADIAQFTYGVLDKEKPTGILHLTNSGSATWFDFAQKIFTLMDKDPERITPVTSEQFPQKAKRPSYSVLDNSHWQDLGFLPMRSWEQALEQFMTTDMRDL